MAETRKENKKWTKNTDIDIQISRIFRENKKDVKEKLLRDKIWI